MDTDTETLMSTSSLQKSSGKSGSTARSLPPEILLSILPRAIPPYVFLDTTLSPGENSPWCKTLHLMKSIVLVCHSWYNAGVVFLYENVCIRRCHQLESLRRTLTSSPTKNLGSLVKSFNIQCYIPEDRDVDFGTDLEAVINCCTSLSTFAYTARFVPPAPVVIRFPAHITHFRLEGGFDFDQLFTILMQFKETLLSFHLMIGFDQLVDSQKLWPQLHLPSLQSLSVESDKFEVLAILRNHWTMPSLQRLTVAGYDFVHGNAITRHENAIFFAFLEFHGSQLRQLRIDGYLFTPEKFKQALNFCPRLERIILHPFVLLREYWSDSDLDDFFHPNLRWIDFTHSFHDKDSYRFSELCLSKKNLPALEYVRRFCNFPGKLKKWLDECPPNVGAETEEFVIDVFQHQLDCREGLFVWRFERVVEDEEGGFLGSFTLWKDSNTDSDSDYEPTSSDEGDTSSSQDAECEWTSEDEVLV